MHESSSFQCGSCRHVQHFKNECLGHDGDCPCEGQGPRLTSPEAMDVNEAGGRQSRNPYFPAGFPARAFLRICRVLREGAMSHEDDPLPEDFARLTERNWHKIPARDHLDHLEVHWAKLLAGDVTEDHAGHIATRAAMFLEMYLKERGEEP